jgi:hypothetical protein
MYTMLAQMWQLGRITAAQIAALVARGRLTQAEADTILATPRA